MQRSFLLVIFLAAAIGAYLVASPKQEDSKDGNMDLVTRVEDDYNQMVKQAKRKQPDQPVSQVVQKLAQDRAAQQIDTVKNEKEKRLLAASQFWGFLYVNTRARVAYCNDLGVDITPFADAFDQAYTAEKKIAAEIFTRNGLRLETIWSQLEPTLIKAVAQDMADIQGGSSLTPAQSCELFSDRAEEVIQQMQFSQRLPEAYATLHAAAAELAPE